MKKVLILTTKDRPKEYTSGLKDHLQNDLDVSVDIAALEDLVFICRSGEVSIYLPDRQSIDIFDVVYIKHWHAAEEAAFVVAQFMKMKGRPTVPTECENIVPRTKFGETFFLALNSLPVPDSVFQQGSESYVEFYEKLVGDLELPFIFKATGGKKGADNYLINTKTELEEAIKRSPDQIFIAQEFIDNDGDYRIINFGKELKIAIHRTRGEGTHLNNTSQGGDGELVDISTLDQHVKDISLAAANLLGRDISGIDVVVSKDGKPYLFEVNYSPQLTTGTFLDVKRTELSSYIKKLLND